MALFDATMSQGFYSFRAICESIYAVEWQSEW